MRDCKRIEFKAGWNPSTIYRTICAFANDFSDIGGVPFDDRPNIHASLDDISYTLVTEHLRQTGSKLLEQVDSLSKTEVLDLMGLLDGPPEMLHPKNVALMMIGKNK